MRLSNTITALSLVGIASGSWVPGAIAQPGLQGSYVGVTVDSSTTQNALPTLLRALNQQNWVVDEALRQVGVGNPPTGNSDVPGNQFQGRLDLPNSPLSVRGTVFVNPETSAVLPVLSYDMAIGDNTNLYAGAGYAFVKSGGARTPIGSQSGAVITTGIETRAGKNLVVYGDTKLNLNDNRGGDRSAVRFQFGAGYRF